MRSDQVETIFHKADAQLLKALEKLHHPILAKTLAIWMIFHYRKVYFLFGSGLAFQPLT